MFQITVKNTPVCNFLDDHFAEVGHRTRAWVRCHVSFANIQAA